MKRTATHTYFYSKDDVFSNFYRFDFLHNGIVFKWSEQAVMYQKAMLFGAEDIAKRILLAKTPMNCKTLGRSKEIPFNQEVWEKYRESIYTEVLFSKFFATKHEELLLSTGRTTIVEASPTDKIWGVALSIDDPLILDEKNWKGLNLLGKVLMVVRKKIAEVRVKQEEDWNNSHEWVSLENHDLKSGDTVKFVGEDFLSSFSNSILYSVMDAIDTYANKEDVPKDMKDKKLLFSMEDVLKYQSGLTKQLKVHDVDFINESEWEVLVDKK